MPYMLGVACERALGENGGDWVPWLSVVVPGEKKLVQEGESGLAGGEKVLKRVALMDRGVRTARLSRKFLEWWGQSHAGVKKLTNRGMQV